MKNTRKITEDRVGRILAVMKPYMDADRLRQIDQHVLLQELTWCVGHYSARCSRDRTRLTSKNLKKFARLRRMLLKLRDDPTTPWHLLGETITNTLKSWDIHEELESVLACQPTPRSQANPIELLVAQDLPFAFKRLFGLSAGRSRSRDQKLRCGPYLAFAQGVLTEMGISYSDESISRALSERGHRRER
jgi:hypothetical protein